MVGESALDDWCRCTAGRRAHLLTVKGAILACEALADDLCRLVYEDSWLMGLHIAHIKRGTVTAMLWS